jgi:hypothetical protein
MTGGFKLRPDEPSENDIEATCCDLLERRGYFPVRVHCGRFRTPDCKRWLTGNPTGTPDWLAVHATFRPFFMEVKRPGEKPSAAQRTRIHQLRHGLRLAVAVVSSREALFAWLNAFEGDQRKGAGR